MPKEVFLVVHENSDFDVKVYAFGDEAWAMKLASRIVGDGTPPDVQIDETLTDAMEASGWLYHAVYTVEGDSVRVERSPLLDKDSAIFDKEH